MPVYYYLLGSALLMSIVSKKVLWTYVCLQAAALEKNASKDVKVSGHSIAGSAAGSLLMPQKHVALLYLKYSKLPKKQQQQQQELIMSHWDACTVHVFKV
jgi:hypothetical protein